MSGQSEASFFIQDSRRAQQLRSRAVAGRVERLFSVRVALSARAAAPAAGPQQQDGGEWVALSALNGSNTEKAKKYILSLCVPEEVQECRTDQQLVEQLLSETSKLRDNLEVQFQTAILPASSPGCVRVQGYKSSVQKTVAKIHVAMVPPQQDAFPQPELRPPPLDSPPTPQSRHSPPTTAGAFSPSPPPPVSTDDTEQQQRSRVTPHQLPNIPTPTSETRLGKEEILRMIASDVERDGHVVPRGADSSLREQAIQYFVSLNFPREKTEAVVNSMEVGAEYDDILQRLNALHVTARPMSGLSQSRPYTQNGEPILSSNATLRPIVIDGSNVAMRHGNGRVFSCRGIQIAVDWFRYRGHREITVFVPQWRRETPRAEYPITDQEILNQLEIESILTFTPSRRIGNKRIVCYDDRFIVSLASQTNGVIVSNDNFRDLAEEDDKWRKTIEHRLVMFTFVNDIFMVPEDPLGKHGPRLSQLLQMEPTTSPSKGAVPSDQTGPKVCPYGERCTFGRRCRFSHPEREGRIDSSILTSRSANTSPAPAERRHTSDIQKDSASSHDERLSPGSGPAGQPMSSPQKPRTSPSFPTQQDSKLYQPTPSELHRYSQPQQGYSQPARQGYQYLGIPVTSSGNTLSPPSLRASSNPSTPVGSGGTSYPSHTFPIANLSVGRPRNMTDKIQPSIPSGSTSTGGEDFLSIAHSPRPLVPSHQHPPPGLVPRGDYAPTPYPPVPAVQYHPSNPHDMYSSYQQPSSNYQHQPQQHHSAYHVHAHAYPPSSSYCMPGEAPHRQPSPVKNSHQSDYSTTPSGHIPPQTNTYHKHPSTDFPPENRAYAADGSSYPQDQRSTPLLHHQVGGYRGGGQMLPSGHSDYGPAHHPTGGDRPYLQPGPRAASMYGGIGARPHEKDLLDRFQSSQSSPELYRNTKFRPAPSGGNAVPSGGASNINWTLFKQAQARLPDQEARIMDAMQRHPNADLEQLVMIMQQSW